MGGLDFCLEELDTELALDFFDILRIFKKSELSGVKSRLQRIFLWVALDRLLLVMLLRIVL